jgi:hypothetical protein
MMSNKYHQINYEMYFHNKLIWSHKCEYNLLETWSNMNHFTWHITYSYMLFGTEVVFGMEGVSHSFLTALIVMLTSKYRD